MELRKDPITRSWVITGDDTEDGAAKDLGCPFCPEGARQLQVITFVPSANGNPWAARAVVHPHPIYRIEGEPERAGNGLYDRMQAVGAHEVVVENSRHDRHLWNAEDREIEEYLALCASRIEDLKKDSRFKYVTVFKNSGTLSGQEHDHPTSEIVATTFVPRRVLYELRAAREHYKAKERCVFCDIIAQEQQQKARVVEVRGDYIASCPYAPRVPYETWIAPRTHEANFERSASKAGGLRDLAAMLRRTLYRIRTLADGFHMVLHTSPNTIHRSETMGYWKTIEDDYHWHIEILPILHSKGKSYTFKEVYSSPVTPEAAAARLREIPAERQDR
jgi:UDPglucose--hexose-1-phosphate uridylyltransferase